MPHRIREAMRAGGLAPLGGKGEIVETDETYYGKPEEPTRPKRAEANRSDKAAKSPATSAPSSR